MKQKKEENIKLPNRRIHVNRKKPEEKKRSKNPLKRLIILIVLIALISFVSYVVKNLYTFQKLSKEMFNATYSTVYDSNKNVIAKIGNERIRERVEFSDIPENLINAYISIEDQRFYSHHGIDVKRTGAAILSYVTKKGHTSFGGSTITQQLVKNLTGNNSNSISRKVKEWFYAWDLEAFFSKEEILGAYFNIIYKGPNIYGVQAASHYYFNKNVQDLTLAECAFLAGINNSPNSYNPFTDTDRTDKISTRTKTVLNKMLELGYVTQDEHDNATIEVNNGLNFNNGSFTQKDSTITSYHTDALINEIISDLSKSKNITQEFSTNYFYLSGSSIYSTVNNDIQNMIEKEFKNNKYIIHSSNSDATSQSAFILIDNSTGYVIGCVGGLGEKTSYRSFNRATQMKRQTGSAMKPIAVLLPAIDKKIVTNVTLLDDNPSTFVDYQGHLYSPIDYDKYKGTITLRQAVETSQNIPFVKIMEQLTAQTSINYLKKMGISTLNDNDINLSLALGGLDEGISPLEFAGAYSVIANDRSIQRTYFLH